MKRTCLEMIRHEDGRQMIPTEKITCECTGENENGSKVWTKLDENGNLLLDEQYFLWKMLGKSYFTKY